MGGFLTDKMKQLTGTKPRIGEHAVAKWLPGRVDMWLRNFGTKAVAVHNLDHQGESTDQGEKHLVGALDAGQGKMFVGMDGERWVLRDRTSKKILKSWTVDVSHGIVQDVVVGIDLSVSASGTVPKGGQCATPRSMVL